MLYKGERKEGGRIGGRREESEGLGGRGEGESARGVDRAREAVITACNYKIESPVNWSCGLTVNPAILLYIVPAVFSTTH